MIVDHDTPTPERSIRKRIENRVENAALWFCVVYTMGDFVWRATDGHSMMPQWGPLL